MANGKRAKKTPPDLKVIGGETEVDPTVAASKIAPITVGNPASAASLAIDQAHLEEYAEADSKSSVVECRRPPKGHFFTVRQELVKPWQDRKFYFILELEGRDPHIVSTAIAKQKRDEDTIRPLMLVRYVTMAGTEGLWPVKINQSDGRANAWNSSALTVLGVAEKSWVRLISAKTQYRHQPSDVTLVETPPKFSDRTFDQLVDLAFGEDRIVTTLDHEIWTALSRGSKK